MYGLNVKLQVFSSQSASYAIHRWTFVVVYLQDKELNEKCTIHNIHIHLPPWPTAQVLQCCCRFFPILYGKIDFANVGPLGSSPLELLSPYSCESLASLCPIGLSDIQPMFIQCRDMGHYTTHLAEVCEAVYLPPYGYFHYDAKQI